ncbi:substrate-binding domain-containing protein [Tabrizicola aquatica]|uniref:substrate-binding domain-containing protein n=1 Tax=Tabrizicola aquatica TaxID=909926 RepID=UPI000CD30A5B|nr:substrate-binding domain-containing protein [Tabrizicola aquatica]
MRMLALVLALTPPVAAAQTADLVSSTAFRVCADPANLPLSGRETPGFENEIAALLADRMDRPLETTWFPMGPGFIRKTLRAGVCDVVIGYAQGDELVQNTNHYYTSVYVLVTRSGDALAKVETLTDPALQGQRIGIVAGTPPASHVAQNGLMALAKPYPLIVDRRILDPAGEMLADLQSGEIDAAILWGPIGGPLVKGNPGLTVTPLLRETDSPRLFYRITMGVRPSDQDWKRELNSLIRRNRVEIEGILTKAGVPLVNDQGTALLEAAP